MIMYRQAASCKCAISQIAIVIGLMNFSSGFARAGEISTNRMMDHIRVLSSDEFEGRAPGTPGEEKTVKYLTEQFKSMGLKPGNPDGTYVQDVPLVGFAAKPTIAFTAGSQSIDFHFPNDAVVWSRLLQPSVKVENAPVVFVGYGVV